MVGKTVSYYTTRHGCYMLQYHLVLVTKYRRPVIRGVVKDSLYHKITEIFKEKGLHILELNGDVDHVHTLFETDPFTKPGELINLVKTQTSRYIRKQYGNTLKVLLEALFLVRQLFYNTTVSENSLKTVREYIRNQ